MKSKYRISFALASACLALCALFSALRAPAVVRGRSQPSRTRKTPDNQDLLRGKRLLAVGAYELNAAFTPDGTFYSFEISATRAGRKCAGAMPRA
ncbi:MAG TPA: hypothetical protein VM934_14580 [Pyrinomonadaceae bacterium]|nr:hypothetical protein [Pyrinomonadaceae bacterium]